MVEHIVRTTTVVNGREEGCRLLYFLTPPPFDMGDSGGFFCPLGDMDVQFSKVTTHFSFAYLAAKMNGGQKQLFLCFSRNEAGFMFFYWGGPFPSRLAISSAPSPLFSHAQKGGRSGGMGERVVSLFILWKATFSFQLLRQRQTSERDGLSGLEKKSDSCPLFALANLGGKASS